MGILNRPQNILYVQQIWRRKYYYGQPQDIFGKGLVPPPTGDFEAIEETLGDISRLLFDEGGGGDSGFVSIEEA